MRPAEPEGLRLRLTREQTVKQTGGEAISAANPIEDVELANRSEECLTVDPGHGAPAMPISRMNFAQGGGDDFYLGVFFEDLINHPEESAGVEF